MNKKRIVIALGHQALGTTLPEQKAAVAQSAKAIADLIEADYQVAVTHSNAPQVGMIHTAMNEFGTSHENYTAAPMAVCSAMSQGYIGYDLQNAIRSELISRGIFKTVATILTQVTVDPYDDAFYKPIKTIGRYMTKEEALIEEEKGNHIIEIAGKGYKRIVAAPKPQKIVEIDAINALLDADQVVIACGGGGIPVLEQGSKLKGASAVIEKDLASAKLAEMIHAQQLVILTGVEKVALNFQKENQQDLDTLPVSDAEQYITNGQFESGTMLEKIEAGIAFAKSGPDRSCIITVMEKAKDALEGKTGTLIQA